MGGETQGYDEVDVGSDAFWALDHRSRDALFGELRAHRPVSRHRLPDHVVRDANAPPEFWAFVRHREVTAASRDAATFRSGFGVTLDDVPAEVAQAISSFVAMDAPRHTQLRRLVSRAFTPRAVAALQDDIDAQVDALFDAAIEAGEGDFVADIAMPLPLWTIAELMGVPADRRTELVRCANVLVSIDDSELAPTRPERIVEFSLAAASLLALAAELADARRKVPSDDLMSALALSEVEGRRLTDEEIGAFFVLLSVAGNDTTRHSMSWGALALQEHPEQAELLRSGRATLLSAAVEEVVRWASPVQQFRRTTSRPVDIEGVRIPEGAKVVLFYGSANRDEAAFADPWRFDVQRRPNDHVGFGGGGIHTCLGAHIARAQLRAVLKALTAGDVCLLLGEPDRLAGSFLNGVKRLPYRIATATGPR